MLLEMMSNTELRTFTKIYTCLFYFRRWHLTMQEQPNTAGENKLIMMDVLCVFTGKSKVR